RCRSPDDLGPFIRRLIDPGRGQPLLIPNQFPKFLRCLALLVAMDMRALIKELTDQWLSEYTSYQCRDEYAGFSGAFLIKEVQAWKNPWPRLINAPQSVPIFKQALASARGLGFYANFATKATSEDATLRLDELLSGLIQDSWKKLVQFDDRASLGIILEPDEAASLEEITLARVSHCEEVLSSLPWTESDYSLAWRPRWKYIQARCHFDRAIALLDQSGEKKAASQEICKVEILLGQSPDIGNKAKTHFKAYSIDDDGYAPYEEVHDLLGHVVNIFVDNALDAIDPRAGNGYFFPHILSDGYSESYQPLETTASEAVLDLQKQLEAIPDGATLFERVKALCEADGI
ncbi:MAG: hypothetical protein ACQKBV_11815, partial [Puniceicoccales bacterium]